MMEVTIRTFVAEHAEMGPENAGASCLLMVRTSRHDELLS